jgi:flagellar hook-associated protein 3 FlgL
MRVSDRHRYAIVQNRVESAKNDNMATNEKVSTQKRINRISDDPLGAGIAIRAKSRISDMEQYLKNVDFSKGYLRSSETALQGIQDYLIRLKELGTAMANSTYDDVNRSATAREVRQIKKGVVALANSQFGDRYVFSGFRTKTPPVTLDGKFVGDDGAIFIQVGQDNFRQINIQPRSLFAPSVDEIAKGRSGLVVSIDLMTQAMESDDVDGIRKILSELDHLMEDVISYQATLGAIESGINNAAEQIEIGKDMKTEALSKVEDADYYKAVSDFKRTEGVLESTLMASNKLLQPSLLNFMQ